MKILNSASYVCVLASVVCLFPQGGYASVSIPFGQNSGYVVTAKNGGVVSSQEKIASQVGAFILSQGGNAVDAAVAMGFAMAVTYPQAGNLGGGGFMLVHDAEKNETKAIDYRETAPAKATADMFLKADGSVDKNSVRYSHKGAGIPGTPRGLEMALNLYGTMSLQDVLEPAITLAEKGFVVSSSLADSFDEKGQHLEKDAEAVRVFLKGYGEPYHAGEILVQPDLAQTLKLIAKEGADAFYKGDISQKIVKTMQKYGGLVSASDLMSYGPIMRDAVWGEFMGYRIASMPPPSSGGVHLVQMLNLLKRLGIADTQAGSAESYHLMAEAMRIAYADRSKYLGDPSFVRVPVEGLISDVYAQRKSEGVSRESATPSKLIEPGAYLPYESRQTTHFSVMDKWGNVVSNTYTLNFPYGSGRMVEGAGFLLNNEMDDFAVKLNEPNAYGLLGGKANKIEPRKRPLSSMTPTIVFNQYSQPVMALGSPGGSRIINSVMQTIVNLAAYDLSVEDAVVAPRVHHQWLPDVLYVEPAVSSEVISELMGMGHKVERVDSLGAVQVAALVNTANNLVRADADLRDIPTVDESDLAGLVGVPDVSNDVNISSGIASYDSLGYQLMAVADSRKDEASAMAEISISESMIASLPWVDTPVLPEGYMDAYKPMKADISWMASQKVVPENNKAVEANVATLAPVQERVPSLSPVDTPNRVDEKTTINATIDRTLKQNPKPAKQAKPVKSAEVVDSEVVAAKPVLSPPAKVEGLKDDNVVDVFADMTKEEPYEPLFEEPVKVRSQPTFSERFGLRN